jgi:Protein kinase domain
MTAVLAGYSVAELRSFLGSNGSREQVYFLNNTGIRLYISRLKREVGLVRAIRPLNWVESMTNLDQRQRWTVDQLLENILACEGFPPFIGDCCNLISEDLSQKTLGSQLKGFDGEIRPSDVQQNERPEGIIRASPSKESFAPSLRRGTSRTPTNTTATSETGSSTPRIRLIAHAARLSSESFPRAPRSLSLEFMKRSNSIPWERFFSCDQLPSADRGIVGVHEEVPFLDAGTLVEVSTILSAHYNKTGESSDIEGRRKNPILNMPKICSILHLLDRHELLGHFIESSINDDALPLDPRSLADLPGFPEDAVDDFDDYQYRTQVRDLDPKEDVTFYKENEILPLRKIRDLGAGGWGVVDCVQNVFTLKIFARKSFSIQSLSGQQEEEFRNTFRQEIESLRKLSGHQHIIQYQAAYQTPRALGLLLWPVAICDLHHYLRSWKQFARLRGRRYKILSRAFGCLPSALDFIHRHESKLLC